MFGNKIKLSQEELLYLQESLQKGEETAEKFKLRQEVFESDFEAMNQSRERLSADVAQVSENAQNILDYAKQNSAAASAICGRLETCGQEMQQAREEYNELCSRMEKQSAECQQVVEQNKHFTTPSKTLSELPGQLHGANRKYLNQLEEMAEYGKQMSVLALNAAIEAGRMGESARSFVGAAEDIRTCAKQYETAAQTLKSQVLESEQRVKALEETVHHLVGLLKENNVGTAKLMRAVQDTESCAKQNKALNFSAELASIKDDVLGIYNLEEETIKAGERNRMQMEDIQDELHTQQKSGDEIEKEWNGFCQDMTAWGEFIKSKGEKP
jgi:methyl-accepting chemotaxis protein